MRRDSFSFFALFQDPVFTIIALVLFATTPMIIPSEGKHVDPRVPVMIEDIAAMEKEVGSLTVEADRLKQESLARQAEYQDLAEQVKQAEKHRGDQQENGIQQQRQVAQLRRELAARQQEVLGLESELQRFSQKPAVAHKFFALGKSDKQDVYLQLVGNRLYPVDNQHYTAKSAYYMVSGGKVVERLVKTRKPGVAGDKTEDVAAPGSNLNQVIKNLNPRQQRLIFLVSADSFPIFRQARNLAFTQGIECGWFFFSGNELRFGPGSGSDRLPSTSSR
jgi:hypothetical protein